MYEIPNYLLRYLEKTYIAYQTTHPAHHSKLVLTYGEILPLSIKKILSHLKVTEEDIFIDFGSGMGKTVIEVFLRSQIKTAYGIEIVEESHRKALHIKNKLMEDHAAYFENRNIFFIQGDFRLQKQLPPATFAIVNATCFDTALLTDLGWLMNKMPFLRTIFSLRTIPNLAHFKFIKTIAVECSWDTVLGFLYKKYI